MPPKKVVPIAVAPSAVDAGAQTRQLAEAERWQKAGATLLSVSGGSLGHPKTYTFVESRSTIERLLGG